MLTLRLTQSSEGEDKYRAELALEGEGLARQTAQARFAFKLTPQDHEDLRWYLEDYLQYPHDPAPKIAARIERRISEIGSELFKSVFQANRDASDLWATLRQQLNETRVEIITEVREATAIPWELIRDPKTDTPLALRALSFVRAQPQAAQAPRLLDTASGPVRILLVICRPKAGDDVPFRSVASRLVKGLTGDARAKFQLDVLRPPTFRRLGEVLRQAKSKGAPYHVVHFDGHGMYADLSPSTGLTEILKQLGRLVLSGPQAGPHGYLLFENPAVKENVQLVGGSDVGKLLAEVDGPVLVLNACRSAHADARPEPDAAETDVHSQVRAFGSLAQEVMDAGVTGVVAMSHNVYVVTAAQFVADLYAALIQGHTLGEAVTLGRKQLADQPLREIAYEPRPLQDWPVPIVYEAAPTALFPKPATAEKLTVTLVGEKTEATGEDQLPARPDVGFFGRDETLLALDRKFDTQSIVLLHAYAGSGKTSTAAEFARWYALTGGVRGPLLFTSFEHYKPLARVLDDFGRVLEKALEQAGVQWLALDDARRRNVAVQAMKQFPLLWIWDNVEPVRGFPAGTESKWSEPEQEELADFLREARDTKAKFLLSSRRDERAWLVQLPAHVTLPPMPMLERLQLARALADKYQRPFIDVEDWRPLLEYTQGNPLHITVVVGQALRDGLRTKEQIEAYVARLRAGEAVFEDEASEGRTKSLGASLSYGFEHAFTEAERKQLALLHLFQGFVDVDALRTMGHPEADWCLPEVRGLTRETGIALLDRTAEVGLLTARGGGYYSIHPALPWYFHDLFGRFYAGSELKATHAFVEALGELGNHYYREYNEGNPEVIRALAAEEANLLHALALARAHAWWDSVMQTMQGLRALYDHTGRRGEWKQLVEEIVPEFIDPDTDGPLPEREDDFSLVAEYRIRPAMETRQWAEAERLQRILLDWTRGEAAPALALPADQRGGEARNRIRSLAASLQQLGAVLREQAKPECVKAFEEDAGLSRMIGDRQAEAITAFNLGRAYMDLPGLRDLATAESWYRRSLELQREDDRQGRAKCFGQLGVVAYERFKEARAAGRPKEELIKLLNDAARFYHTALELLPPDAAADLAVVHHYLGSIYGDGGQLDRALVHYRESIRCMEILDDVYSAAVTRFKAAVDLAGADRFADALLYARAALRNLEETYDDRAAADIELTRQLIARIEQDMKAAGSSAAAGGA